MFRDQLINLNRTHSPTSLVQTDDVEAFARAQEGMMTSGNEWILIARDGPKEEFETRTYPDHGDQRGGHAKSLPRMAPLHVRRRRRMTEGDSTALAELLLARDVETFLIHEAGLLDDRRFEDWADLFTEDGYYWRPQPSTRKILHPVCRSFLTMSR